MAFLLLSGCSQQADAETGLYTCARISRGEELFEIDELYPGGLSLRLDKRGQGELMLDGESFYCRWNSQEDKLTLDIGGELVDGSLSDGVCILYFDNLGTECIFLREGARLTDEGQSLEEAALSERQLFWNGDWYGVWKIENATGVWIDQTGQSFDCFAHIELSKDGSAQMVFWDELHSRDEPAAIVSMEIGDSATDSVSGVAESTGGYFFSSELLPGQWSCAPELLRYDGCFVLENCSYTGEEGSFDYSIFLRPWGRTWEDIEAAEPWLMPYFYYDWYLPLLSSQSEMPDKFEQPRATVSAENWSPPDERTPE